ncbi:MAG: DUF2911 domain-containing protein [Acidobacteriia bacterium]|nr:DUF2911 domain-containing protein [Terriglobia bacterium]
MNRQLIFVLSLAALVVPGVAQQKQRPSPPASTEITVNGKKISVNYSAPSMKGRHIFNGAGALQPDDSIWRAGANEATVLHTDANLDVGGTNVPAGDYALYIWLDKGSWSLILSKQSLKAPNGRALWGINMDGSTTLDEKQSLGRIPLTMSKPPAPVETYKMTLASEGGNRAKLTLEWENVVASVPITVK